MAASVDNCPRHNVHVDRARIDALSSYEDPEAGIRERFLAPQLGGGRTIAILSEPLGGRVSGGWVICHSFGPEYDSLGSFEATLARRLAAMGCAALRFHVQGYGDSELETHQVSLERHVVGATEATDLLSKLTDASSLGLIGARFGGSVAALAADRVPGTAFAALHPAVRGRTFLRSLIALYRTASLADGGHQRSPQEDPWEAAARTGTFELHGSLFTQEALLGIDSLDVPASLASFRGRSLVLQVSRVSDQDSDLHRLTGRLAELGGHCTFDMVVDEQALRFGLPPWRRQGIDTKVNVLAALTETILTKTVSWCAAVFNSAPVCHPYG